MNATSLRERIRAGRHGFLLLAIILAFSIRPLISDATTSTLVFSAAMLLLLLMALYTTQVDELVGDHDRLLAERKRWNRVGWLLALPALTERIYALIFPTPKMTLVTGISWFLFLAFVTFNLLRTLIRHRDVTNQTIALSISVYLLIGMTWSMLYILIFNLQDNAFSFNSGAPAPAIGDQHVFPTFLYFSLTTISTMGFGDIVPLTVQARFAAVAEGISGQFYMAVLVARLVSLQISASSQSD